MLLATEKNYYQRQLNLNDFTEEDQCKLKYAKVLIIGMGALGCPVAQYLCGMGVGTLGLMDADTISVHNLHRQTLYSYNELGKSKVLVAHKKLKLLNPFITFNLHKNYLTPQNAISILKGYDLVVDCTDNFPARFLINDACVTVKIPFVHGSILGYQGQLSMFNTPNGPTYRCIFPEAPLPEDSGDCINNGVIGVLPGIIGLYQALECFKYLCNKGDNLIGKLLLFNALTFSHQYLYFDLIPENKQQKILPDYQKWCGIKTPLHASIHLPSNTILIDVRTFEEFNAAPTNGKHIPLDQFLLHKNLPSDYEHFFLVCTSGKKSALAKRHLENLFPNKLIQSYSLKELTEKLKPVVV